MRLFHLSDLHLGKKLNEAPLLEDQRFLLAQIVALVAEHKPDAVLIAGDVYDRPVPSADAVSLLDTFLTRLAELGAPVLLISGNHDSAERLAFGAQLFSTRRVYVSPVFDREHAAIAPVRFTDGHGAVCLWMLPFIKPAHVRAALPDLPCDTYTQAMQSVIGTLFIDPGERNVLLCHQYITGGERAESEEISVGGVDQVDASVFAPFDYVALGHLHRAQSVARPTVRYCGSPMPYSFSEVKDHKGVTLVTLLGKGDVRLETLPLTPKRALRELRGDYETLTLRKNYEHTAVDDYLHITLTDAYDVPDALARLQSIYPNLLKLDYDNARTRGGPLNLTDAPEHASPLALLNSFYALQNGEPMNEEQRTYAQAALERAWEGRL